MPTYTYEAMNNLGQPVKDAVDAASSEEAIAKIRGLGYFPTKIKARAAKKGRPKTAFSAGNLNPLIVSGIPRASRGFGGSGPK